MAIPWNRDLQIPTSNMSLYKSRSLLFFSDVVRQRLDALLLLELLRRLRVLPPPVRRPVALPEVDDVDVDSLQEEKFEFIAKH